MGTVKAAMKREQGRDPKYSRVSVNLERPVLEALRELARQKNTSAADYVRNMIEARVLLTTPKTTTDRQPE